MIRDDSDAWCRRRTTIPAREDCRPLAANGELAGDMRDRRCLAAAAGAEIADAHHRPR
jgi:hypothetical protein